MNNNECTFFKMTFFESRYQAKATLLTLFHSIGCYFGTHAIFPLIFNWGLVFALNLRNLRGIGLVLWAMHAGWSILSTNWFFLDFHDFRTVSRKVFQVWNINVKVFPPLIPIRTSIVILWCAVCWLWLPHLNFPPQLFSVCNFTLFQRWKGE